MRGSITSLVMKNPPPFQMPRALAFPYVSINMDRDSVLTNTILIEEIVIDSPEITYEGSSKGSNLSYIQERVQSNSMGGSSEDTSQKNDQPESTNGGGKRVQIARVVITNAKVNLSLPSIQGQIILADRVLKDIGKQEGGIGFQEAGAEIFGALIDGVKKVAPGSGKLLGEGSENFGGSGKELGKEAEKIGRDLLKGILNEK